MPISGTPAAPPSGAPALCSVSYSSLDVPDGNTTAVNGVNNSGTMAGSYFDAQGIEHGFILSGGQLSVVNAPNAVQTVDPPNRPGVGNGTELTAIANSGAAVGNYVYVNTQTGDRYRNSFMYQNGQFKDVGDGSFSFAQGINSAGVAVGSETIVGCCGSSWIRNPDGSLSRFSKTGKGEEASTPEGINDSGQIAGPDFIYTPTISVPPYPAQQITGPANGNIEQLTLPGMTAANVQGMNSSAQLVGYYSPSPGATTQLGWMRTSRDSYCTLSVPGAVTTHAMDLSDAGLIVGWYSDANKAQHGFVAK